MVKIRLKRMGMKKEPFYRIVVTDSRNARDGRFIEEIGYYNPLTEPAEIKVDQERAKYWLGVGAQPTDTTRALLKKGGALYRARRKVSAMGELVRFIAQSLVEHPEAVEVREVENADSIVIELRVAEGDMGKVIGKQGRIAKAIRTVVKAATAKDAKPVFVEIL